MQAPITGWLEAFDAHPDLGSKLQTESASDGKAAFMMHSSSEQSGIQEGDAGCKQQLVSLNEEYRRKFGHVFLLCAQGKSAEQTLQCLRSRCDAHALHTVCQASPAGWVPDASAVDTHTCCSQPMPPACQHHLQRHSLEGLASILVPCLSS